jgi:hypothetical protein
MTSRTFNLLRIPRLRGGHAEHESAPMGSASSRFPVFLADRLTHPAHRLRPREKRASKRIRRRAEVRCAELAVGDLRRD